MADAKRKPPKTHPEHVPTLFELRARRRRLEAVRARALAASCSPATLEAAPQADSSSTHGGEGA